MVSPGFLEHRELAFFDWSIRAEFAHIERDSGLGMAVGA